MEEYSLVYEKFNEGYSWQILVVRDTKFWLN